MALVAIHLLGYACLMALAYSWLGTSESDALHLLWSLSMVLVVIAGACWLHGVALLWFDGMAYPQAAVRAARHTPALVALAFLALTLYLGLEWLKVHEGHTAFLIGSYATMSSRRPVAPSTISRVSDLLIALLQWMVLPTLLFPRAAAVARLGWAGLRLGASNQRRRWWVYAIEVAVLLLCAFWVPLQLFFWIPKLESFSGQMLSLALRVGAGYLLFVGALLGVAFFTAAGKPVEIQPKTVPSP